VGTVPEGSAASATAVVDDDDEFLRHLAGLSPRERAVLVLRFHADLTEREVADELRLPIGTVKSLASRALTKLRAKDTSSTSWSRP
jgi:RNA polymerase sigma factor (sigma-70 family)